ncbi:hypothetical protein Ocin01_11959 [Orchesella cincta]|uniref:F5/8 type C domain-containing protein n=1 Tax=Orchesella cincta TaxID=48709 RepID=A0A1D2MPA1_ORCCI|nr:hypothetical protein Ocin01_11959 [Orchesella cincta]
MGVYFMITYLPTGGQTLGSQNEVDWLSVDFGPGRVKTVDQVKLYVYSDVVTEKEKLVRVIFARNQEENWFVGIAELEIWAPWPQVSEEGIYEAEDGFLTNAKIGASETASSGSYVGEIDAEDASVEVAGIWLMSQRNMRFGFTIPTEWKNKLR